MRELRLWLYRDGDAVSVYESRRESCDEAVFLLEDLDCEARFLMDMDGMTPAGRGWKGRGGGYRTDSLRAAEWIIRHQLKGWSFDVPLVVRDGMLDDESFGRAMRLPAGVLARIVSSFRRAETPESERAEMSRQAYLLFGSSGSVEGAHPMVSMYLMLSEMWEKFGLNYFDLKRLPDRLRDGLRDIMRMEGQARAAAEKSSQKPVDEGIRRRLGMR